MRGGELISPYLLQGLTPGLLGPRARLFLLFETSHNFIPWPDPLTNSPMDVQSIGYGLKEVYFSVSMHGHQSHLPTTSCRKPIFSSDLTQPDRHIV